jgi:hypothetical protein
MNGRKHKCNSEQDLKPNHWKIGQSSRNNEGGKGNRKAAETRGEEED